MRDGDADHPLDQPLGDHGLNVPLAEIWSRDRKPRIFAQPTPNQISQKKIVTIDMPVDMTMTDDTVLKYTLYC